MQSYLFNNKRKNALFLIVIISQILVSLAQIILYNLSRSSIMSRVIHPSEYIVECLDKLSGFFPYVILFVFFFFLNKKHNLKHILFPLYFLVVFIKNLTGILYSLTYLESVIIAPHESSFSVSILSFVGLAITALLFVGSLNNFKFIKIFRVGIALSLVSNAYSIYLSITTIFSQSLPKENFEGPLGAYTICSYIILALNILFNVCLLLFTFNKKDTVNNAEELISEPIEDIKPVKPFNLKTVLTDVAISFFGFNGLYLGGTRILMGMLGGGIKEHPIYYPYVHFFIFVCIVGLIVSICGFYLRYRSEHKITFGIVAADIGIIVLASMPSIILFSLITAIAAALSPF